MGMRKVSKIGPSTLMISLPIKWVKKYGIKKGDELDIEIEGKRITIDSPRLNIGRKVNFQLDGLNANLIRHVVYSAYRNGSDEIELFFENNVVFDHNRGREISTLDIIDEVVDRLVGVEILKQKKNYCLIKEISSVNYEEFDNALRRIFITLASISKDIYDAMKNKDKRTLESIKNNADKKINKLSDFCQRIINKGGVVEVEKVPQFYALTSLLEEIGDSLMDSTKIIIEKGFYKYDKTFLVINEMLEYLYKLFCDYKKKNLIELYDSRKKLENLNVDEKLYVHFAKISSKVSSLTSEIIALHFLNV